MVVKKISQNSQVYPNLLRNITDPPSNIYGVGDISLLQRRCITIVGTRECTQYGENIVAEFLKKDLQGLGFVFVSGLAKGIDAKVHEQCLRNGLKTIAVVAGGIDVGYPRSNQGIYDEICKKGLVISEYSPGYFPAKYMFPRRNRIMVGLSASTLVVESKLKGGSMVTAQLALDYNRDLYAIPGNIKKESSQGCNNLIQNSAYPVLDREDFLRILGVENEQTNFA